MRESIFLTLPSVQVDGHLLSELITERGFFELLGEFSGALHVQSMKRMFTGPCVLVYLVFRPVVAFANPAFEKAIPLASGFLLLVLFAPPVSEALFEEVECWFADFEFVHHFFFEVFWRFVLVEWDL